MLASPFSFPHCFPHLVLLPVTGKQQAPLPIFLSCPCLSFKTCPSAFGQWFKGPNIPSVGIFPGQHWLLSLKVGLPGDATGSVSLFFLSPAPLSISYSSREEAVGSLVTFVVWHWDRNVTLAKGSESPLLSAAMRPRAWYMCALSWKTCWAVEELWKGKT